MVGAWLSLRLPTPVLIDERACATSINARALIAAAHESVAHEDATWAARADAIGLDTCEFEDLLDMVVTAPDEFSLGLACGKHVARLLMATR
jgi:hypothetical protein